jgi:hypothetical protein
MSNQGKSNKQYENSVRAVGYSFIAMVILLLIALLVE